MGIWNALREIVCSTGADLARGHPARGGELPHGIVCSRCGARFTPERPARPWFWSLEPYWPIHRDCA